MNPLKLFVVNETDGANPDEWGPWHDVILVLAENAEQAKELCGDMAHGGVAEVVFDKPKVLLTERGADGELR